MLHADKTQCDMRIICPFKVIITVIICKGYTEEEYAIAILYSLGSWGIAGSSTPYFSIMLEYHITVELCRVSQSGTTERLMCTNKAYGWINKQSTEKHA